MKITLDYLAGFFDGEGCVSTYLNRSRRGFFGTTVSVSQSGEEGKAVLQAIQKFLLEQEIVTYFEPHSRVKGRNRPMWVLRIGTRDNVVRFLMLLRGRVSVKKVIVEDTLRFLLAYPPVKGKLTEIRNKERAHNVAVEVLRQDRAAGLSYKKIAKKHSISWSIVYERLNPERTAKHNALRREQRRQQKAHPVTW